MTPALDFPQTQNSQRFFVQQLDLGVVCLYDGVCVCVCYFHQIENVFNIKGLRPF